MDEVWRERAACRLPGAPDMHPVDGVGTEIAIAWCLGCPVQIECAEAGILEPFGVWGGMSERQRASIRKRRGLTARSHLLEVPCQTN